MPNCHANLGTVTGFMHSSSAWNASRLTVPFYRRKVCPIQREQVA